MANLTEDIPTTENDIVNISDGETEESETSSISGSDSELEDEELVEEEEELFLNNKTIEIEGKDRITRPFMTKYELVRIIGTRKKQLSLSAKPMIKITGDIKKFTIDDIIKEEIKNNMIPFKIKRPQPDSNRIEIWDFSELSHKHLNIVW